MLEEIIFILGIVIFSVTSLSFLLLKRENSELASLNLMVNFATVVSYSLMLSGLVKISAINGEMIYWSRWAFYGASCSFLMVEISRILNIEKKLKVEIVFFNSFVMIAGLLASVTQGVVKWLFFTLSTFAYLYVLSQLFNKREDQKFLIFFVAVFWSGFPVVWLLSPAGFMVINAFWTAVFYLVLDLITKVYFGYYTTRKHTI